MTSVLLVEDNPMDVDLTRRVLARSDPAVSVEVARDGEEALAHVRRWEAGHAMPSVILLDLKLPKVNGLELLRYLKEHPHLRVIPIVVLTTSLEPQDVQEAYLLGTNSYVVKPVDFDRFVEVVDQIRAYWCAVNQKLN